MMLRPFLKYVVVALTTLSFISCREATDDEQLIRQYASGGHPERISTSIDRKFESKWGSFYFVRNVELAKSGDTTIGLVGVTTQSGRRFAFVTWAWSMKELGGTKEYSRMIETDSIRYLVGPNEWWKDSVFWKESLGKLEDTTGKFFAP
jgi:hypothetical protein